MKTLTRSLAMLASLFLMAGHHAFAAETPIGTGFNGPQSTDTWWFPNDPNAAVGPNHVMVAINGVYRIYNKSGTLLQSGGIASLFANATLPPGSTNTGVLPVTDTLDPNITYDDIAGRFVVEATQYSPSWGGACIAISDTSDPTQGFTESHVVPLPMSSDGGKIGFNADVYVVWHANTPAVFMQKSTMLDLNTNTFTVTYMSPNTGYGRPARMHGATNGAPFYFTSNSGSVIGITRVLNVLSTNPTFNTYTVAGTTGSAPATPCWRNNTFALTTGNNWWIVDTSTTTPMLTQSGSLPSPPSGYSIPGAYDSIEIAPNGDVGMTYMMLSADTNARPVSMWVTWRAASDPAGTMRPPVCVANSGSLVQANGRHGDFSSTVCDISTNGTTLNTFWACNGYIRPNGSGATDAVWMQQFGGSVFLPPTITSQPQNVTVGEGSSASFNVTATGAQLFQYQWLKGGVPVPGATNNPYLIAATSLADAGNYTVVITNSAGSATSAVAVLTIIPANDGVWVNAAGGSWTNNANWSGGLVATGIGKTANFSTLNITANPTVTLDGARTIGNLSFADTAPSHNWTLGAGSGGLLTLDDLDNVPTITVSNQTATISAVVAGVEGMAKNGAGTLALSTQTTYTGDTTVNAGILNLTGGGGGSGTIRGAANVNPGATLRLSTGDATGYNGGATALTVINLVGGTLNLNTTANQTLGSATINMTGGVITGVAGANLDFFNGASTLNTLASATSSTISGTKINLRQNNGVTFTVASGSTASGIDLDVSSVVSSSAGFTANNLTKAGLGTMRLTGVNTYTNGTTISAGTLALGVGGSIASSTPITIASGALFDVSALGSFTLGAGKVLNAGRFTSPATDLNGNLSSAGAINPAGIFTINGNLTLTGGSLTYDINPSSSDRISLAGAGRTLTLTGTTTVTPASGYYANGTYTLINGFTGASGTAANLAWGGTPGSNIRGTPAAAFNVTSTNATVTISGGTPVALNWKGILSGAWDINTTANWLNTVPVADNFYNLDTVTFSDSPTTAAVTLATPVYPGAVTFNNTATSSYTFSGAGGIAGSASVSKTSGNGTVYLNLTNTYSGGTTISAGTISLGNNANENVSGLGTGPVTVNTGGTLKFAPGSSGNNFFINNPVTLNGGTVWVEDGKQHLSGPQVAVGASGGTLSTKWGAKDLWIDSQLTGSGPLTVANTGGGSGTTGVHFSNSANTYSGTITVNNSAAPAQVANTYALSTAVLNLTANNTLLWDGVTQIVLGGLSGSGSIANGGNALSVGFNNGSTTYSGALSGPGAFAKVGAGTFTLGGNNLYTGTTTVSAGTLLVNGSLAASSTVTVQTNATLSGTGTINGETTVQNGGALAPGANGIGKLNFSSSLVLSGGSVMELSRNGGVLTNDVAAVTGTLTQGGSLIVTNIGTNALVAGNSFKLFNAGSWSGNFTSLMLPTLTNGLSWNTNTFATNGTIAVISTTCTLTYIAGANGSISGTMPQTVNYGASGTAVTATANTGYHFVNWSDGGTANPRTDLNVTNNLAVTANFAINTCTLTYTSDANGTLSGTTPQTVNYGASGTAVTAVPNSGYAFTNWSDGLTLNPRTDVNVTNNITVTANFATTGPGPLPAPWTTNTIGIITANVSATYGSGTFEVTGGGANVSGKNDNVWFVNQPWSGDATLTVRVASEQNTGSAAKAGVMIRESTATGSRSVFMGLTPTSSAQWVRRSTTGGNSSTTTASGVGAPYWVRLTRGGNTFTGYISTNGASWTQVASASVSMNANYSLGLAVCSGSSSTTNLSVFDSVSVTNIVMAGAPQLATLPPTIGSLTLGTESVDFSVTGETNSTWLLQESTNGVTWTPVQTITINGGTVQHSEADDGRMLRLFRLQSGQ